MPVREAEALRIPETATAGPVAIPHGFSKFFVTAAWTP